MSSQNLQYIEVRDYDPQWPVVFGELTKVLGRTLRDLVIRFEHVGSTSVPGLAAKPIIDIDTVIASRDLLRQVYERLATLGYVHIGDGEIVGREVMSREGDFSIPRDGSGRQWMKHNLYVVAQDARELKRHTAFRDYLRSHPDKAREYGEIKKNLGRQFTVEQIQDYIEGKNDFIHTVYRQIFDSY
jgi:GrpB-like predicted nucleotidyltransferase (UPF0157 family)